MNKILDFSYLADSKTKTFILKVAIAEFLLSSSAKFVLKSLQNIAGYVVQACQDNPRKPAFSVSDLPNDNQSLIHVGIIWYHYPPRSLCPVFLKFKNFNRSMRVPFVVFADFECYTEKIQTCYPNESRSFTNQYQHHKPSGFCYLIKCFNDELMKPKLV